MKPRKSDQFFWPLERPLSREAARSGVVALLSNLVQMVLGIGTTLVLVRILEPTEFGIFAVAWIVVQLTATVRDVGIATAVVNIEDISRERISGLFWSGQIVNLAVTLLILLIGPVLSHLYNMPELTQIMPALALASFFTGLASVHDGLLKRNFRFGVVAFKDIAAMAAGAIAAIAAGLEGLGVWALTAQQLALAAMRLAVCFAGTRWLPEPPLSSLRAASRDRALLQHGAFLSLAKCIDTLGASADRLILGLLVAPRTLGFYQQAVVWSDFPARTVYNPMYGVVVSAFSRKQSDDAGSYRAAFRQAVLVLYAICVPMLIYGAIQGELVILVLLGNQWTEAAPFFSILCVAMLFRLVVQASKWVYVSESRSGDQLVWTLAFVPSMIIAAVIGAAAGSASGVCVAILITYFLAAPIALWYCTRRSRLQRADLISPAFRPLVSSLVAAITVMLLAPHTSQLHSALELIVGTGVFAFFNAIGWATPGSDRSELRECLRHFSPRLAKLFDHIFTRAARSPQVP